MASIFLIYKNNINNLNLYKTLILEKTIQAFQIKKTEFDDMESIKKSTNFVT